MHHLGVRNAYEETVRRMKKGESLLERELNLILDPESKLKAGHLAVLRELYDQYPRKP